MCDRCAALEDEVAWLKSELGLVVQQSDSYRQRRAIGLSPSEYYVARLLYDQRKRDFVSAWVLIDGLEPLSSSENVSSNTLKVYLSRIRRRLGGKDTILSVWSHGYRMSESGAAAYEKALAGA